MLVNPANGPIAGVTLREVQEAAGTIGLQIYVLHATTIGEIDAAFALLARERPDALFVAADPFLTSRRVQIVTWRRVTGFRRLIPRGKRPLPAG